jgi:hypothetical protein
MWAIPVPLVAGGWLGDVFAWFGFNHNYLAMPVSWAKCREKASGQGWSSG